MAGLGCGLGLPLFFALCAALVLLRREKQKYAAPKLMYKLPDDCKEDQVNLRPPQLFDSSSASPAPGANSTTGSRRGSLRTVGSKKPAHVQNFLDRYEKMKKGLAHEMDLGNERHELDSTPPYPITERYELGGRMSR
ncbi:hypothetical protein LTR08_007482 [Meristemomyces frigidus]|nr:hypothetical protein LTR08_007482 [Meristemomyces frigidus]